MNNTKIEDQKLEKVAGGKAYTTKSVKTNLFFSDGSIVTNRMITVSLTDSGSIVKKKIADRFSGICDGSVTPNKFGLFTTNWKEIKETETLDQYFTDLFDVELNAKLW